MTDRSPQRTDSDLVAAHLGGDSAALAAIYDRYADSLHDTAAAMLSDRHDAQDITHDVFVIAAEQLARLRDRDRLKPWLFAILRNEVYRRSKRRSRVRATDFDAVELDMSAPADPHADAADVERAELATFVREAAAGLAERDQLLLELTARQGLAGADLADAVGVSQQQCHVMLHRMRARVQRSLGALTVARQGRNDCPDLQELLSDWDGTFDPRVRKRIASHVDDCETCDRTSRKFAVVPLLSAAPVLAAPPELRTRVLQSTRGTATSAGTTTGGPIHFDPSGFPTSSTGVGLVAATAVVATVVLLLVGGVWLAASGGSGTSAGPASGPTSASAASTSAVITSATAVPSTTTVSTTVSPISTDAVIVATTAVPLPTTTTPPTTTTTPPTTPPTPGTLVLSASTVDLGSTAGQAPFSLANTGDQPLSWSIGGDATPFVWSSLSGELSPGKTVEILVAVDRGPLDEGSLTRVLTFSSSALGTGPVTVTATVEHPPTVSIVTLPSFLRCPRPSGAVVVDVLDESSITDVVLEWTGPGQSGSVPMIAVSNGWAGRLSPDPVDGGWTWEASATDARGNVGTVSAQFIVSGC